MEERLQQDISAPYTIERRVILHPLCQLVHLQHDTVKYTTFAGSRAEGAPTSLLKYLPEHAYVQQQRLVCIVPLPQQQQQQQQQGSGWSNLRGA
jgi:hypothetical protein